MGAQLERRHAERVHERGRIGGDFELARGWHGGRGELRECRLGAAAPVDEPALPRLTRLSRKTNQTSIATPGFARASVSVRAR